MKNLSAILGILLLLAIGMIVKLKQDLKATIKKPPTSNILTTPEALLVLHLKDPVSALQRYYELFPDSKITEIDIGMNKPNSDAAKAINKKLGLPLISGKDPFPRDVLYKIIAENVNEKWLHFAVLNFGASNLYIGSERATPSCTFPPIDTAGDPIYAQIIPWIKLPDNSKPYFENAQKLGYTPCGSFIPANNEGYIIDPQGYLTLLQGNQKKR